MTTTLAEVLKLQRTNAGLTQLQVAERLGVSRAAVGQWESGGQISTENLIKICQLLGIEVQSAVNGVLRLVNPRERLDQLARRLEAIGQKIYDASAKSTPLKLPSLIKTDFNPDFVPVYFLDRKKTEHTNAALGTGPLITTRRTDKTPDGPSIVQIAFGSDALEPIFADGTFVHADLMQTPTIGDYVILLTKSYTEMLTDNLSHIIRLGPVWMGEIVDFRPSSVRLRQFNPAKSFDVPLTEVAGLIKLLPG